MQLPPSPRSIEPYRWGQLDSSGAKTYRLHPAQSAILKSTARFKGAIAGTGGGKTVLGPIWIMQQIARILSDANSTGQGRQGRQGRRSFSTEPILGMVIAPTYQILARATAPALVSTFSGTDYQGQYVESRNRYYLPRNMGTIWTLSADNAKAIEGGQVDFVWLDEGGQVGMDVWIAIQGRTGQKQSPVLITTTPYALNWLYKDFYKRAQAGDPQYFVKQWASKDNPAYPPEEYQRAKRTMTAQRAAMRYDGQFVQMAGLIYPTFRDAILPHHQDPDNPDQTLIDGEDVGGIDFGWNNPFAALAGKLFINDDGDDVLYIYYERYKRSQTVEQHARALPKPGAIMWWADPARPDSIAELRGAGHAVRAGYNDIMLGIDAVSARLLSNRLKISPLCRALIAESDMYAYPEKDDEVYGEKPVDQFNHALDALRYLVMGIDRRKMARGANTDRFESAMLIGSTAQGGRGGGRAHVGAIGAKVGA
jgi:phage terminase large subunit